MKVEARLEVDRHRDLGGESVHRLGEQDLAPQRRDRQIQADHGAAASRPGAGGADYGARPDRAVVGDDLGDLVAIDLDVKDLAVDADLRAMGTGTERVSLD